MQVFFLYGFYDPSIPFTLFCAANDTFFVLKLVSRHSHAYGCSQDLLATLRAINDLLIRALCGAGGGDLIFYDTGQCGMGVYLVPVFDIPYDREG